MTRIAFTKGHGTGNDFLLFLDPDGELHLADQQIQRLCDRHFGLGADGILRAVHDQMWFMDYRNADGGVAEMCGNGIRVFAEFLYQQNLIDSVAEIRTRAGIKQVERVGDNIWSVDMGIASTKQAPIDITVNNSSYLARSVNVGNPHLVIHLHSLQVLPTTLTWKNVHAITPDSEGFNLEFYEVLGSTLVSMRVLERGVGETLSCGTGVCAVAQVHMLSTNQDHCEVHVPGGVLQVQSRHGKLILTGPAELIADGFVELI